MIAGKGGDKKEIIFEISDLAYHLLVLMAEAGIGTEDIVNELANRQIVDKKVKQQKMQ